MDRLAEQKPQLIKLFWRATLVDSAIHRRCLAAAARLQAVPRLAHLVCEFYLRLGAVGLTSNASFDIPITQSSLSDILGMSTVHLNRSVQSLKATRTITWKGNSIAIYDWERLVEIGGLDPDYLNFPLARNGGPKSGRRHASANTKNGLEWRFAQN